MGSFLAVTGFLAIGALTLVPVPEQSAAAEATPLWCLVCGDYGGVDVLNNVLLFVPLGAGLMLLGVRLRTIVALGALVSLTVESLQLGGSPPRLCRARPFPGLVSNWARNSRAGYGRNRFDWSFVFAQVKAESGGRRYWKSETDPVLSLLSRPSGGISRSGRQPGLTSYGCAGRFCASTEPSPRRQVRRYG